MKFSRKILEMLGYHTV